MRPAGVLEKIAASTVRRIARAKADVSEALARELARQALPARDFAAALTRTPAPRVIAEVKLASPSSGALGRGRAPAAIAKDYADHGACAVSVLTEPDYFAGSLEDLAAARRSAGVPLLMKDFVLEEYQLLRGRSAGADAALLIAGLLGPDRLAALLAAARYAGLAALVEVHDEAELEDAVRAGARIIGVNNRSLATLTVDLDVSRRLARLGRGAGLVLVCESGISARRQLDELGAMGYHAFLVGTSLMREDSPGLALARLRGIAP